MRILVADAQSIVRHGLRQLIADTIRPKEICEVDTGADLLSQVRSRPWHLLVLDLALPDVDGLELLRAVRELRPGQRVLVFSLLSEQHYAVQSIKAGASGYVSKSQSAHEIVKAMRRVLQGDTYVSATLADRLTRHAGVGAPPAAEERLTGRELQVLRLLGEGRSVTQIGQHLHLSVKTVSTHRVKLLRKLGLKTTADLIRFAIERNLTR